MFKKSKKLISICLAMILAFSVTLPVYAEPITIGDYAFDETTGHLIIYRNIGYKNIITDFSSIPREKIISVTINEGVTYIGTSTFLECTNLREVHIPNSVKFIGANAFEGCTSLTHVNISHYGYGNVFFDNCAFDDRKDLEIHYNGVIYYDGVFSNVKLKPYESNLKYEPSYLNRAIIYPMLNGLDAILRRYVGKWDGYYRRDNYIIPKWVKCIGEYSFSNCKNLKKVTIPNSVISIEEGAFSNCTGLTSVTIPKSVTSIGEGAFSNCTNLKKVRIPKSVTEIGDNAFQNCTNLKKVTLPKNILRYLIERKFQNCPNLKK